MLIMNIAFTIPKVIEKLFKNHKSLSALSLHLLVL